MTSLLNDFRQYLKIKKLSQASVKNYVSDVRQFLAWSANNKINQFNPNAFSTYKSHLLALKTPTKSINRYLSSLRKFGSFLKNEKLLMINPAQDLENIQSTKKQSQSPTPDLKLIEQFRQSLKDKRLKPATIKNYVSDVNQFLTWLNTYETN